MTVLLPLLIFLWLGFSKGQDYIFTGQEDQHYDPFQQNPNQFINPSNIIPFRQSPTGFHPIGPSPGYIPSDLQTSDLPSHLQHTLPQYRFTTTPPQFQNNNPFEQINYQTAPLSSPSSFRTSPQYLKATTLRPNYSHLYSKNHGRHPSQTEMFLGQITLQNPDSNFKRDEESFPENGKSTTDGLTEESGGSNSIGSGAKQNFLNHRTRIVAPDSPKDDTTKPQRSEYFVNTNGEVYQPTTKPIGPTKSNAKFDNFKGRNKEYVPNTTNTRSVDLGPLLEEPLKDNFGSNNDDEVQVIKSKHENEELTTEPFGDGDRNVTSASDGEDLTTEYEDEEEDGNHERAGSDYYADEPERSVESSNDIQNEDREEEGSPEADNSKEQVHEKHHNSTYEVITSKPTPMVKDTNFHDFVDTAAIDTTEANHDSEPTTVSMPVSVSKSSSVNVGKGSKNEKEEPEVVISIVTSKTVVNNTVVASVTPNPLSTETVKSTTESSVDKTDNTTDTWVVVASVQTSRSVSGARYLPSSIVEQDVRVKQLNEHPSSEESSSSNTPIITTDSQNNSEEKEEENEETTTDVITTTVKTSTESLIDKLDQVQSDLSSRLSTGGLGNNIAVIKEPNPDKADMSTMEDIKLTTSSTTKAPYPQINIRKYSPTLRKSTTKRPRGKPTRKFDPNRAQATQPDITDLLSPGYRFNASDDKSSKLLEEILNRVKPKNKVQEDKRNEKLGEKGDRGDVEETTEEKPETTTKESTIPSSTDGWTLFKTANQVDISKFLPPGYKLPEESQKTPEIDVTTNNTKSDISKFLPPGYKLASEEKSTESSTVFKNTKADDISKFLPPGFKVPKYEKTTESSIIFKNTKGDDVSKFLPPGYKVTKSEEKTTEASIFKNTKTDDLSKFLPPGYTLSKSGEKTTEGSIFKSTKADDVSKFLPPGFKIPKYKESSTTERSIFKNTKADEISKFLPPGYKLAKTTTEKSAEKNESKGNSTGAVPPLAGNYVLNSTESSATTTTKSNTGFKVVFPSRPGGGTRKSATRTTPRSSYEEAPRNTPPTIHKGWPSRATTEFTGWPTPSTTPISIEKLLEAARAASSSTTASPEETTSTSSTTTTSTTTTTTTKPTTPGVCVQECDLFGTIRLVGGVKWVPELLDRNTKEWQLLANEVESQLDYVYSTSTLLKNWYKKIRIDGFSEGSVLVDYFVELNDVGRRVDTQEMKKLFHESLDDALLTFGSLNREGKALNEIMKLEGKLSLGNFLVDPASTDFLVLPKQQYPTVGMANDDVLLPQWAIAVIVIGLASLLFVIIFGVTVLVNRQKNAKKKNPTPLTEDMLNELNKNHMGGLDNYGADDLYNMEDVWNDKGYEQKPHKKRSNGSLNDNSMSNLYDSWRSEWNGYYYNAYYGNNPGSSHSGYNGRRRSDYDTNF